MEPLTDEQREKLRLELIRQKALINRKLKRRARHKLQKASRRINRKGK